MIRLSVICLSILLTVSSVRAGDPAGVEFFEAKVRPVLAAHCYQCHSQAALDAKKLKGDLFLDSRDGVLKGGENGPVLVPGKPAESRLLTAIRYSNPDLQMPPKDRLSDAIVADLEKWIAMGAPDPREMTAPVAAPAKRVIDIEAARKYWAFQPLAEAAPPTICWEGGRTPIDQFIYAKLAVKGLRPNETASRAVLIRRAYADLIGLPPTPAEVDAFVKDPAPDAWEHLLDKLLASDHYGERWGRHWLDIVRFAESNGYEFDGDRAGAYQYRDFVIRAFNRDMPYDEFVRWQLAGDKLLPGQYDAGAATGFLTAGPSPGQLTAKTEEPLRYDQLDDMVSTLGSSMLAMTIGCCRCHDHKFDPLPQRDYYRLISCFADTDSADLKLDPKPEIYQTAEAKWKADNDPLAAAWTAFMRERMPIRVHELVRKESQADAAPWLILDPDRAEVSGGKLKKMEDGSFLVEDRSKRKQTLTVVARTHVKNIAAIRLEGLADKQLPKEGPGIGPDGEFTLSGVEVRAAAITATDKPVDVKLNPIIDDAAKATQVEEAALDGLKLAVLLGSERGQKGSAPAGDGPTNYFMKSLPGARTDFTGNVGYEFVPTAAVHITALGRSVGAGPLAHDHQIILWDTGDSQRLADVTVTSKSPVDKNGFANEPLKTPITLEKGKSYRISTTEEANGDPFFDVAALPGHLGTASVTQGVWGGGTSYPDQQHGPAEQGYGLPTFFYDATGAEALLLKSPKRSNSFWESDSAGKNSVAVIRFNQPVTFDGGTEFTITLKFDTGLAIGRTRVAIATTQPDLQPDAPSQPQALAELQALMVEAQDEITDRNRPELARWMQSVDDETVKAYAPLAAHLPSEPKENFEQVFGAGVRGGRPVYFLGRGETNKKNGLAPPGFLEVLVTAPEHDERWTVQREATASAAPTKAPPTTRPAEPRVAMAEWITDVNSGAGQLLARVIVNRLWQHHMGRGLAGTPNDFGVQGELPTHPELLDFLARQLIANGWHLKPIQKMIMSSSVYMETGAAPDAKVAVDPENKFLWRHAPQRLEAEAVRDSLLAVSGSLDEKMFGPGSLDDSSARRSVYLTVKRSKPVLFMQLFDAPEAAQSIGQRQVTTVATQALTLMNSPFVRDRATQLSKRIRPDANTDLTTAIESAYRLALCRLPNDVEEKRMKDFIEAQAKTYPKDGMDTAVVDFCQLLLCSDEFVYVD